MPGKSHQVLVVQTEQGRLECLRQRQIVAGRYQCIHQRQQVLHLGHLGELTLLDLLGGHTQSRQRLLHGAQQRALARQHHHVLRLDAPRRVLQRCGDPTRRLRAFQHLAVFFGLVAWALQRVAPQGRCLRTCSTRVARVSDDGRQGQHLSRSLGFGGMRPKALELARILRRNKGAVHAVQHRRGVAPGVVAAQQRAAQFIVHKCDGGLEHLRLCAAEAVNALLGVAHDEDARRIPGAAVGRQPTLERLPLQRTGVLEFIDQHMRHARVQLFLHPTAEHRIRHEMQRQLLQIVHVHPAALALERRIVLQQAPAQAGQALLVFPGVLLALRHAHPQQQILRLAHLFNAGQGVVEFAGLVLVGEQCAKQTLVVAFGQGIFQLACCVHKSLLRRRAQHLGRRPQQVFGVGSLQRIAGLLPGRELRKLRGSGGHRPSQHARRIRQRQLDPLGQRALQRFAGVAAPMGLHQCHIVRARWRIGGHAGIEATPDLLDGRFVVFEQGVARRQPQGREFAQRRARSDAGKPAVESAHLHWPPRSQQLPVQATQAGQIVGRGGRAQAALGQRVAQLRVIGAAEFFQPLQQARTHLASGFFGEGDGQNFVRLRAFQQGAQHARYQHPGLARPGTGLHHHVAGRVAGHGVKLRLRDRLPVARIGCLGQSLAHATAQKSLRHMPRAAQ